MKNLKNFWDGKKTAIPMAVPNISEDVLKDLKECINTGWVVKGRFINQFEEMLAKYTNLEKVVTVQNCTAGLHEAYKLLGVEAGDEVIVPNVTYIPTVNTAVYLKAHPVFMDCDDTLNMDFDKLEKFLERECEKRKEGTYNKKSGKRIKVITPAHLFGNLIDMERLMSIAERYGIKVLEDASQAMGSFYTAGKYKGMHAGTVGHIGVVSFNSNKIITSAGGGAILSNDLELLEKARFLSMMAKNSSPYIHHDTIGYDYSLINIQGAIGVSQMKKLEEFVAVKTKNYNLYKAMIKDIEGINLLSFNKGIRSNYCFYPLIIDEKKCGISRNELFKKLTEAGIQTCPLWGLMSDQEHLKNYQSYKIENSKIYVKNTLIIPCSTNLKEEEVAIVVERLKEFSK